METTLFESKIVTTKIVYNTENNLITIYSSGDQSSEAGFREVFETFLTLYPKEKHASLLFDSIEMTKTSPSNRAWFATSVIPRFLKLLAHPERVKIAVAQPTNLFEQMTTNVLIKAARALGLKSVIKTFDDLDKAKEWVLLK